MYHFLTLFILIFTSPLIAQISQVDWDLYSNLKVEIPERKLKGTSWKTPVMFVKDVDGKYPEMEKLPDDFTPTIDTIYKQVKQNPKRASFADTFYISRISHFFDNKGNADVQYFYPNGQLIRRINYVKSDTIIYSRFRRIFSWEDEFYRRGDELYWGKGSHKSSGVANGIIKNYFPDGTLREVEFYDKGLKNGIFTSFYKNGQLKERKSYVQNEPEGIWKLWSEEGELKSEIEYKNGELTNFHLDLFVTKHKYFKLQKQFNSINKDENEATRECLKTLEIKLPIKIAGNKLRKICVSDLQLNKMQISNIECFPMFGDDYETLREEVLLLDEKGIINYKLFYSSGQLLLEYNFDCEDFLNNEYQEKWSSEGSFIGQAKSFYSNGQLHIERNFKKCRREINEDSFGFREEVTANHFTKSGKLKWEIKTDFSENCEVDVSSFNRNFYDKNENLLAVYKINELDETLLIEILYYYPNGTKKMTIRKKSIMNRYILDGWQELYDNTGKLKVKEYFSAGEFVK